MFRAMIWLAAFAFSATQQSSAADPAWKSKKIADWDASDGQQVITASPWAKAVTPEIAPLQGLGLRGGGAGRSSRNMSRGGGMSRGGMSRGGMGGGGIYSGGRVEQGPDTLPTEAPPTLTLRWESALPIRTGEEKAGDARAPEIDAAHYVLAVYGVPVHMSGEDSKDPAGDRKKHAFLKREGKKELKPDSVELVEHEDGPVFVFFFPRSTEISKSDVLEFDAQIGRLKIVGHFTAAEMMFDGKLEL